MEATYSSLAKVQRAYRDFVTGDIQTLIENISEDVIWNSHLNPASPYYGAHQGIESIEEYLSKLADNDIREADVHTAIESGNKSIVLIDVRAKEHYVHVLRCSRGKVIQIDIYNKSAVA